MPEARGYHDAGKTSQVLAHVLGVQLLAVHPLDVDLGLVLSTRMLQRLLDALVGVMQLHVLADQADVHLPLRLLVAMQEIGPCTEVRFRVAGDPQLLQHHTVQAFLLHHHGHVVDGLRIPTFDHRSGVHVAEEGDLLLHALLHRVLSAAHQYIRLHSQAEHFLHTVLGGLGLQLTARL